MLSVDKSNYYFQIKKMMMKEFHKIFKGAEGGLVPLFDNSKIELLREKCELNYISFFPQLPYVGGKSNMGTINIITGAAILSLLVPLEEEGLSQKQIGRIIYTAYDGYFQSKPRLVRQIIGKIASSRFYMSQIKKQIDITNRNGYADDFILEHIASPEKEYDLGYDYKQCALHILFQKHGKSDYLRYVCLGDYSLFRSYGIGFYRTQTIGNGGAVCDFRFKKSIKGHPGWPPEELKEWNGCGHRENNIGQGDG